MACLYFTLHSNHLIAGSTSCICYIFLTTGEGLNKWSTRLARKKLNFSLLKTITVCKQFAHPFFGTTELRTEEFLRN